MPYLNVKLCTQPSQETADLIAKCLTDLTAEILKKKRELTAVAVRIRRAITLVHRWGFPRGSIAT